MLKLLQESMGGRLFQSSLTIPRRILYLNYSKFTKVSFYDKDTIMKLNRVDDNDQITLGYHVIEFLLWGEDNNASSSGGELLRTMMSLIISLLKKITILNGLYRTLD